MNPGQHNNIKDFNNNNKNDNVSIIKRNMKEVSIDENKQSLCRMGDWNDFFLQTHLSRTHQDWFDPFDRKITKTVRNFGQRKQKRNEILNHHHNLIRAHHNPGRRDGFSRQEVEKSSPPAGPTNLMVIPEGNQFIPNTQQTGSNMQPMMYNPNTSHNPVPPCQVRAARPGPSAFCHQHPPPWPSPRHQYPPTLQRRTSPRFDPMAKLTFIDDPRRRPRK